MKAHITNKSTTVDISNICIFPGEDYLFIQIFTEQTHPHPVVHWNDNKIIIQFYEDVEGHATFCPDRTILTLIPEYIQEIKVFKTPLIIMESNRHGVDLWLRQDALKQHSNMYEADIL